MTDLSYDCTWDTVIVLDNWLGPNRYECKIYFDIETENGDEQNIAFERCQIMLETIFNHGVFININNPLLLTFQKKTKQKIITLPTEPLDVIVAAVIYSKLNAVCEGRLNIAKVKIKSVQGDNIWVHFDEDFANDFGSLDCDLYASLKNEMPWWQRPDPATGDWFEVNKKELKFHKQNSIWDKTLLWPEGKTLELKKESRWKPQVIDGGKETKH
jgi:hypothetical protein